MAEEPKPIPGYVRCGVTHLGAEWRFEVLADQEKIAIVDIETADGMISVGLTRDRAIALEHQLKLFLTDWPKDQVSS